MVLHTRLLPLCAALAVLAVVEGCGPGQKPRAVVAAVSATPNPASAVAAWRSRGATEVPPSNVARVALTGIDVVNQTAGQVSDADAQRWAEAMLRTYQYTIWATIRLQQDFLLSSGLSDAPQRVFGPNLRLITQARSAGATRIAITPVTIQRLILRPVPAQLRGSFTGAGFTWDPYAFYLGELGPYAAEIVDSQQHTVQIDKPLPPGAGGAELIAGRLVADATLGAVWIAGSDWDCTTAASRQTFGGLCTQ